LNRIAEWLKEEIVEDLPGLLWPSRHSPLLAFNRTNAIVSRVHVMALVFGILTLAWSGMDFLVFPRDCAIDLAFARLVASLAFAGLAGCSRDRGRSLYEAYAGLALLFIVPVLFFAATQVIVHGVPLNDSEKAYVAAIALAPFVMASGLALFPLVALESCAFGAVVLLAQAWSLGIGGADAGVFISQAAVFGLLMTVVIVSVLAGMTQVNLMNTLVTRSSLDELTGCYRRESGKLLLQTQFRLARRTGASLAVMFADLDHFKEINDRFGHDAGDEVLAAVTAAMRNALRASDMMVRWGGEEFVIMLPEARKEDATRLFERMRSRGFSQQPDGGGITVSMGIAAIDADGAVDVHALIDLADRRMYLAKQAGRDRCVSESGEDDVLSGAARHRVSE